MSSSKLRHHEKTYDVVVVGGGPGGLPAAIAAARGGARTLLVEATAALGGAAASGLGVLGFLDRQGNRALGGFAQEFMDRLAAVGGAIGHFPCPVHNSISPVSPDMVKIVAVQMCREAGVDILFNNSMMDAEVVDGTVQAITVFGKLTTTRIQARTFIDGTGDGDLAFAAGARFESGQEGTGEMQPSTLMFTVTGHDLDKFFTYLDDNPAAMGIKEDYAAGYNVDFLRKHRGHCFIGLTDLVAQAQADGDFTIPRNQFITISTPSDRLLAINTSRLTRIDSSDPIELSDGLERGYLQVLELLQFMRTYVPGFESAELSQIAPALGVRETRHFVGDYRLTFEDVDTKAAEHDAVALSGYNIDIHSGTGDGIELEVVDEAFGIPYGCLVPQGVDGLLLSGRTISVDSRVFASARVMGTCMAIGEAAGTAAALALRHNTSVREVDVPTLQAQLVERGAILPQSALQTA